MKRQNYSSSDLTRFRAFFVEPSDWFHVGTPKECVMIPSTRNRVPAHTSPAVNRRIDGEIEKRLAYFSEHPSQIEVRLRELDREWDIERAIEMNASALAFVGTSLGALRNRNWLILPALVTGFLFQHAVQGWCPPVPILRRLGFRTVYEIEQERRELLALRNPALRLADPSAGPGIEKEPVLPRSVIDWPPEPTNSSFC